MEVIWSFIFGFFLIVMFIVYVLITSKLVQIGSGVSQECQNVMIVIAHPDDECMFLAPTILNLLKNGKAVSVLCLTTGNYNNLGDIRKLELAKSCEILGVKEDSIEICDHKDIQDGPGEWDVELVSQIIQKAANKQNCQILITFDDYGVSGHPNHISTYQAVHHIVSNNAGFSAFYLKSVRIFEKYCHILLSLPLSFLTYDTTMISSFRDVWKARKAMFAHRSQFVWYRMLYIICSRYMVMNTLRKHKSPFRGLSLVVNADDFGYSEIRNQGILECYLTGAISSATLMVNGVAAKHAVALAKMGGIPLGLHLNITEGDALSAANKGTSFVDKNGQLLGKFGLREAILNGSISRQSIQNEIKAQIEKFRVLTGEYPYHVDGHHHIHIFPDVCEVFAETLESYNIKSTRLPLDVDFDGYQWADSSQEQFMNDIQSQAIQCKELFPKHGLRFTDKFMGITMMGAELSVVKIKTLLNKTLDSINSEMLKKDKRRPAVTFELMVHPGYPGPTDNAGCGAGPDFFSMSLERKREMDVLMSDELLCYYKDKGVELCSF